MYNGHGVIRFILLPPVHSTSPLSFTLFLSSSCSLIISFLLASLPFLPLQEEEEQLGGEMADFNQPKDFYSSQDHEAGSSDKKYGGLAPKKKPLISKDNGRAFFDSADWALCKQGAGVSQTSTVAIETLRPKLQRTPHQQLPPRRPACTSDKVNHQGEE